MAWPHDSMPDDFNPNAAMPLELRCPECGWDGSDQTAVPNDLAAALEVLAKSRLYGLGTPDDLALDAVFLLMKKYGLSLPENYEPMDHG